MKRIGILGGTFNPLHTGHLAIAEAAQEKMNLDKVIFVPSSKPPHKRITHLATAQQRLEMVRLSVKNNPKFDVSDFEVKKGGKSYTIDTVKYFHEKFGAKAKLFFIVGIDAALQLHTWRNVDKITQYASFVVVNRPGHGDCVPEIPHYSITMPGLDIASSYIRRRIHQGKSIKYLVPEQVFRYIEQHNLFQ